MTRIKRPVHARAPGAQHTGVSALSPSLMAGGCHVPVLPRQLSSCLSRSWLLPVIAGTVSGSVFASPQGGQVVAGSASITQKGGDTTVITQHSQRTAIDWQRFNVGSKEYVQFIQPGSSAVALNRVIGGNPSQILGNLSANGQVFLVNPDGIYFGRGATVNVGGLVASVLDIDNRDFMTGNYVFHGTGARGAGVINDGLIRSAANGYVVLLGDYARNNGIIEARMGTVALASGRQITMDVRDNGLISVVVDKATLADKAGVKNAGRIEASGGRVVMSAKVANDLIDTAINNEGLVVANAITERGGAIFLTASGGDIVNRGTLDASARTGSGGDGGGVLVHGQADVELAAGSRIDVAGDGKGGGGVARVIAEDRLDLAKGAKIEAAGGDRNGGFVEVSGHGALAIRGEISPGAGGELLIDPAVLRITNDAASPGSIGGTSIGGTSFVGRGFIENQLNTNVNVTLVASSDIVSASGSGSSGGGPTFTINATSGSGDLAIINGVVTPGGGLDACSFGVCLPGTVSTVTPTGTGNISLGLVSININGNLKIVAGTTAGNVNIGSINAGRQVSITAGGSINVSNIGATAQASQFAEIRLAAGGNLVQATGGVFSAKGGGAFVTATAGGNVTLNGTSLVTAIAGGNNSLGGATQFGVTARGGDARVNIRNVGGNVTLGSVTAVATATGSTTAAAAIAQGDAEVLVRGVGGNVTLNGQHTVKVGNGSFADADIRILEVVGNVAYNGTASITAGTQSFGSQTTEFEIVRVGGNVTINGGGITVKGGASRTRNGDRLVLLNPDSIGGKLDVNAPITLIGGVNRDVTIGIDTIGGVLNVSNGAGLLTSSAAKAAAIAAGTANFSFVAATASTPCGGVSCGNVTFNAPINLSVQINGSTQGIAHSDSDARIQVDRVFGNLTLNSAALVTIVGGTGSHADASFDIGGSGAAGVRGNVVLNADMNFSVSQNAADASLDFDHIGGDVIIGGNMTFNAVDDARILFREITGNINITGNTLFNVQAGSTHEAAYDIKRIGGDVNLGGTRSFTGGDDATVAMYVHDVGGNVTVTGNTTLVTGNRVFNNSNATEAEVDFGRIAGNVTFNGNTVLRAGNNAETGFNIHSIGGTFAAPVNGYDDLGTSYNFTQGGCTNCGITVVTGDISQDFNNALSNTGAIGDADFNFHGNIGGVTINGNLLAVSQTSMQLGAANATTGGGLVIPVNLTVNGNINAGSDLSIDISGDFNLNGNVTAAGSSLLIQAGRDLNIGTAGGIGSSSNLQNAVTTLTAGRHVNIQGDVYVGNQSLNLIADNDSDGLGDVSIIATTKSVTVKTLAGLSVSGANLRVNGGAPGTGTSHAKALLVADDSNALTTADDITIDVAGRVAVQGGSISGNFFSSGIGSAAIRAGNDLNIVAGTLDILGGNGSTSGGSGFSKNLNLDASVTAGNNITLTLGGNLTVRGGNADARLSGSDSFSPGKAIIDAKALLSAGGTLHIVDVGGTLAVNGGNANGLNTGSLAEPMILLDVSAKIQANNLTIDHVGGQLNVAGGVANARYTSGAKVGAGSGMGTTVSARAQAAIQVNQNIQITAVGGALNVSAGTALASYGLAGINACASCPAGATASASAMMTAGQNLVVTTDLGLNVIAGAADAIGPPNAFLGGTQGTASAAANATVSAGSGLTVTVTSASMTISDGVANPLGSNGSAPVLKGQALASVTGGRNVNLNLAGDLAVNGGRLSAAGSTLNISAGGSVADTSASQVFADGNLILSAGQNVTVNGQWSVFGSSFSIQAGNDLTMNGHLGSPSGESSYAVNLVAGNHMTLNGNIQVNGNVTLRADNDGDGVGDININGYSQLGSSFPFGANERTISTRRSMNISAVNLNLNGADLGTTGGGGNHRGLLTLKADDGNALTTFDNIDINLSGVMTVKGGRATGFDRVTRDVSVDVRAGHDITVNAAGVVIQGGVAAAEVTDVDSSTGRVKANSSVVAGNNLTVNVSGNLTISAGTALATASASGGVTAAAFANADTNVTAGGDLTITVNGGDLTIRSGTANARIGSTNSCTTCTAIASAISTISGNNVFIDVNGGLNMMAGNAQALASGGNFATIDIVNMVAAASNQILANQDIQINALNQADFVAGTAQIGGNWIKVGVANRVASPFADVDARAGVAVTAGGNVSVTSGSLTARGGSASQTFSTAGSAAGSAQATAEARLIAGGALSLVTTSGNLTASDGSTASSGNAPGINRANRAGVSLTGGGSVTVQSGGDLFANGVTVVAGSDVNLAALGSVIESVPNTLIAGNNLSVQGGGDVTIRTLASAGGTLVSLSAGNNLLIDTQLGSANAALNKNVNLQAGGNIDLRQPVVLGNNQLTMIADTDGDGVGDILLNGNGPVTTQGSMTLSANRISTAGAAASFSAGGDIIVGSPSTTGAATTFSQNTVLNAGNRVFVAGQVVTEGDMTLNAASLLAGESGSGQLSASGNLILNTQIGMSGAPLPFDLGLSAGGDVQLNDVVVGDVNLTVTADSDGSGTGDVVVASAINTQGDLTLSGASIRSTTGDLDLGAGNNLSIDSRKLIGATGNVNLSAVADVILGGGITSTTTFDQSATINGNRIQIDTQVNAMGNLAMTASQLIAANDLMLAAGNDLSIDAGLALSGSAISLQAGNHLLLNADAGSSSAPLIADVSLQAGNDITLTGAQFYDGALDVVADSDGDGIGNLSIQGQATSPTTISATGNMHLSGVDLQLQDASLNSGAEMKVIMTGSVSGGTGSITANGMYFEAGGDLDLSANSIGTGTGTVAGVDGDAAIIDQLLAAGITPPDSGAPNAKFRAGGVLSLGTITMAGNVPYLWMEADSTSLQALVLPEATDVLVQYSPFTPDASIGVEAEPDSSQDVNYNNLQHFDVLPGTTVIIGGSAHTGSIHIGDNGDVDIADKNFVAVTASTVDTIDKVISNGVVAELIDGGSISVKASEEFVAPVLSEVEVEIQPVSDTEEEEKERKKNLVKDDEQSIKMCEAG